MEVVGVAYLGFDFEGGLVVERVVDGGSSKFKFPAPGDRCPVIRYVQLNKGKPFTQSTIEYFFYNFGIESRTSFTLLGKIIIKLSISMQSSSSYFSSLYCRIQSCCRNQMQLMITINGG